MQKYPCYARGCVMTMIERCWEKKWELRTEVQGFFKKFKSTELEEEEHVTEGGGGQQIQSACSFFRVMPLFLSDLQLFYYLEIRALFKNNILESCQVF